MKDHKIFIGFTEVGEYHANLKKGFQQVGYECVFISINSNKLFQFAGDDTPNIIVYAKKRVKEIGRNQNVNCIKYALNGFSVIIDILLFIWASLYFDVFIFTGKDSFFGYLKNIDLLILKILNKRIIYHFSGSDARPPFIGKGAKLEKKQAFTCINDAAKMKERIKRIEKYSDFIVVSSSLAHFFEKKIIQSLMIGIPKDINVVDGGHEKRLHISQEYKKVRILHAPSNIQLKGTEKIRESIKSLIKKGHNIEYIEIIGKKHSEVMEELKDCDFIIDQLYSDTPMATFAAEAAFMGKPAVVGGYYSQIIHDEIPEENIPPSYYCHPNDIEYAIEKMIVDIEFREEMGKKALIFVQENWNLRKVAEKYLKLIEDKVPKNWYFDPNNIQYLHGAVTSEKETKYMVRRIIETSGIKALQLSDKPKLEEKYLEFIFNQ